MITATIIGVLALVWMAALYPVWALCVAASRGDEIAAAARDTRDDTESLA